MSSVHTTNSTACMHNTRIGIDLGGTKIEAVAINAAGDIICRNRMWTWRRWCGLRDEILGPRDTS